MDIRNLLPLRATSPRQLQGREAEARALAHLRAAGLTQLTQNYRCRYGEIDLVMREGSTLVFVEVRERRNTRFGSAAASVTRQKQEKIIATAQHFLQHHANLQQLAARFDVVALNTGNSSTPIEWLKAAFTL